MKQCTSASRSSASWSWSWSLDQLLGHLPTTIEVLRMAIRATSTSLLAITASYKKQGVTIFGECRSSKRSPNPYLVAGTETLLSIAIHIARRAVVPKPSCLNLGLPDALLSPETAVGEDSNGLLNKTQELVAFAI